MNAPKEFTLTENHLLLLRNAYVSWDDCEFGAPEIDPKRPYGNSDVLRDIARIVGLEWDDDAMEDGGLQPDTLAWLNTLHRETETALQLVLGFGAVPGAFRRPGYRWERA